LTFKPNNIKLLIGGKTMISKILKHFIVSIGKIFIEGYNTLDGHVSGINQIRIGLVMGMWFIQFNILVYSIRIGIIEKG
jgi:hypothetical protein